MRSLPKYLFRFSIAVPFFAGVLEGPKVVPAAAKQLLVAGGRIGGHTVKLGDDVSLIVIQDEVVVRERAMPDFKAVLSQGYR